jgi:hypothetical protein
MNRYHIALGKKPVPRIPEKALEKGCSDYSRLNKKIIEKLFETIKLFIAWAPISLPDGYNDFSKDFNIFKVSLPSRAGNTTLALKLLEYYEDSILIVMGATQKFDVRCRPYRGRVFGPTGRELCGHNAPIVIVDLASHMSKENIERIYSQFHSSIFIFIA